MDVLEAARTAFPRDYADSRKRFLAAARRAKARIATYDNPNKGPGGEALATDCAWIGPREADRVLVLLSGTHGVEAFCGAGCIMDFLATRRGLPRGLAVLAIHAINPHGFAWIRRVTEEGVDLNRNFIDDFADPPANPGYDELADAILPPALAGPDYEAAQKRIAAFREKNGIAALHVAFSGGQYKHPQGLFFGGFGPTWSHRTHAAIIDDHGLAQRRHTALIDYHTGLGPHGYGELISVHPPDTKAAARAKAWWGASVTEPLAGTSIAGARHGFTCRLWEKKLGDRVTFITVEYGTYDTLTHVRPALVADHWLHAQGPVKWRDKRTQTLKQRLKDVMFPPAEDWREAVIWRSRQVIRMAGEGLAKVR
jgi:hypothetical protein